MPIPLAAIGAATQLGLGAYQAFKASKIKTERPKPKTPDAIKAASRVAGRQASLGKRPEREVAENAINQNQANTINAIQQSTNNPAEAVNAAIATQGSANKAMQQQDIMDANFKNAATARQIGALQTEGAYQQRAFDQEVDYYNADMASKAALTGAAVNNLAGGINDGLSSILIGKDKMLDELARKSGINRLDLDSYSGKELRELKMKYLG